MSEVLAEFEKRIGLSAPSAARLLGTAYSTYAQYKAGHRDLPKYHQHHVQALLLLDRQKLQRLIEEHAHGRT